MGVSVAAFITDVGGELLFFCLCSLALTHSYYAATLVLRKATEDQVHRWGSALLSMAFVALCVGQLFLFGLTGLEKVEVPFYDDRNRFIYFWIVGIAVGFAGSYPIYRKRLILIGRGFLTRPKD